MFVKDNLIFLIINTIAFTIMLLVRDITLNRIYHIFEVIFYSIILSLWTIFSILIYVYILNYFDNKKLEEESLEESR